MIVTIEVDKEAFDNIISKIQSKKTEIGTSIGYDEKLRKDVINGRFFDGRVAVEKDYDRFCDELLGALSKIQMG